MDPTTEATQRLLVLLVTQAERQTRALESIRLVVLVLFALGLIGAAAYLISAMHGAGVVA